MSWCSRNNSSSKKDCVNCPTHSTTIMRSEIHPKHLKSSVQGNAVPSRRRHKKLKRLSALVSEAIAFE